MFCDRSYLARIGLRGRSSVHLESWWPHTRTSLGPFPRCSQSVALLEEKERRREMFSQVWGKSSSLPFFKLTFHPEIFVCFFSFLSLLHSDPAIASVPSLQQPTPALLLFQRQLQSGPCFHILMFVVYRWTATMRPAIEMLFENEKVQTASITSSVFPA